MPLENRSYPNSNLLGFGYDQLAQQIRINLRLTADMRCCADDNRFHPIFFISVVTCSGSCDWPFAFNSWAFEYNNEQIALFEKHAGETGFRIINGFLCLLSVDDRHMVPMTLITEYPDEAIYDNDFIRGYTAHMKTVLSAYDALQCLSNKQLLV